MFKTVFSVLLVVVGIGLGGILQPGLLIISSAMIMAGAFILGMPRQVDMLETELAITNLARAIDLLEEDIKLLHRRHGDLTEAMAVTQEGITYLVGFASKIEGVYKAQGLMK